MANQVAAKQTEHDVTNERRASSVGLGVEDTQSSVYDYLNILGRQAWLVVLVTLLAGVVAAGITSVQTPVYRAQMKLVAGPSDNFFQPGLGGTAESFTQTISSLLESDVVARAVIESLDLQIEPSQLLGDLNTSSRPQSTVLDVTYDSTDRGQAVAVLNEIGDVFPTLVNSRLSQAALATGGTSDSPPRITVGVFDPARLAPDQVAPRPVRTVAAAGGMGLLVGLVLAFLRDGRRVRSRARAPSAG